MFQNMRDKSMRKVSDVSSSRYIAGLFLDYLVLGDAGLCIMICASNWMIS